MVTLRPAVAGHAERRYPSLRLILQGESHGRSILVATTWLGIAFAGVVVAAVSLATGCAHDSQSKNPETAGKERPNCPTKSDGSPDCTHRKCGPENGCTPRWRDVSLGSRGTCGITEKGRLYCWGFVPGDYDGREPTRVDVPGRVSTVDLTRRSACATTESGRVYCWGSNRHGQLGAPESEAGVRSNVPTPVRADGRFEDVALGPRHACALHRTGRVFCWGRNASGQLGVAGDGAWMPVEVPLEERVDQLVALNDANCALSKTGAVWCWGENAPSPDDENASDDPSVPRRIGSNTYTSLAAADEGICAIRKGQRHCWPSPVVSNDGDERSKTDTDDESKEPPEIRMLALDSDFGCMLTEKDELWCWGNNGEGMLGDGTTESRKTPKRVSADASFVDVDVGFRHACAIDTEGGMHCWGASRHGQLGFVDIPEVTVADAPPELADSDRNRRPHAGKRVRFLSSRPKRMKCVGFEDSLENCRQLPGDRKRLGGWRPFRSVGGGVAHVCVVGSDGRLRCAGRGWYGELGDGTRQPSGRFLAVGESEISYVHHVSGHYHVCGLTEAGEARCWGFNRYGAVGPDQRKMVPEPTTVDENRTYRQLVAGRRHSCGLAEHGDVFCWGWNRHGQLGDGTAESDGELVRVTSDRPFVELAAAHDHTCARSSEGGVYCWGRNDHGQVAPGADESTAKPTEVPLEKPAVSIGAGMHHVCAVSQGPELHCWGVSGGGPHRIASGSGISDQFTAGLTTCIRDESARLRACFSFHPKWGIRVRKRSLAATADSPNRVTTPHRLEWPH